MYQVIVEKNGRKLFANCTFEQVSETVSRAEKANMTVLDVLCKKTVGVRPSDADMPRGNGYYKGTPEGWISAKDSTIDGLGYTVKFDMLGERHIDMMCDALNGWECVYSKVKCVFKDEAENCRLLCQTPKRPTVYGMWWQRCKKMKRTPKPITSGSPSSPSSTS